MTAMTPNPATLGKVESPPTVPQAGRAVPCAAPLNPRRQAANQFLLFAFAYDPPNASAPSDATGPPCLPATPQCHRGQVL